MLVYGEITSINGHNAKMKVNHKNFQETGWLYIPQYVTHGDKSSNIYEIGTEVAAITSETFDEGCIVGAVYNKTDTGTTNDKNIKTIIFSDGSVIEYNKQTHIFTLDLKGDANITAQKVVINGDLEVRGNVSDTKGSMQKMRDTYNEHTHSNGNNGANTGTPNGGMN
ncbi:phage baseplate assembly protein V [bacterium]|nr:phage baseplate assembly protein V [bacterium]